MNVPLLSAIFASSCLWIPDPRNGAFSEDVTLVKRVNTQYTKPIHKRLQATQRSETSNTEQIGISTEVIQLRTGKWTPPEAWEALTKTIPLAHLLHPYSQLGTQLQIPMGPPPNYTCESSRRSRQSRRMSSHRGSRGTASIRGQRDARYCSGGGGGRTPSSSARVTLAGRSPLPHYRLLYTHCRRPRRELPPSRLLAPAPRLRSGAAPSRTSRPSAYSTSITASQSVALEPVHRIVSQAHLLFHGNICASVRGPILPRARFTEPKRSPRGQVCTCGSMGLGPCSPSLRSRWFAHQRRLQFSVAVGHLRYGLATCKTLETA